MSTNLKLGGHKLGQDYGYYIDKVPQNVLEELGQQINRVKSNFSKGERFNHQLIGEIEHEYLIHPQPQTKQYIRNLSQQFENEFQYMFKNYNPIPPLKVDELWVNFQKKHEYNPIHNHNGVYSFVIWYQIPFTFENEKKYSHKQNNTIDGCKHGKFSFVIPDLFSKKGNIITVELDIDQSKEGYIAIFPSTLHHTVNPFYSSDEYRITIAGNVEAGDFHVYAPPKPI
jgi:hypothetical protein